MPDFNLFRPSTWFDNATPDPVAPSQSADPFPAFDPSFDHSYDDFFETAEDPGFFSGIWDEITDDFASDPQSFLDDGLSESIDFLDDAIERGAEYTVERLETVARGFDNAWDRVTSEVETGFDATTDALEDFTAEGAQQGRRWDETLEALDNRKYAVIESYDRFEESARKAFDYAHQVGAEWLDRGKQTAADVTERAQQLGMHMTEARIEMIKAEHPIAFQIADVGFDVARGAVEAGEMTWNLYKEDPSTFKQRMLTEGLDEIEAELLSTEHGQRFSTALDIGVWSVQSTKSIKNFVEIAAEGLEPAVEDMRHEALAETLEIGFTGPPLYASSKVVESIAKARAGEYSLRGRVEAAQAVANRAAFEYAIWYAQGNGPLAALALTAVGDDNYVSDVQLAKNAGKEDPTEGLVPRFLDPIGAKPGQSVDPDRVYFVNGILNEMKTARTNAEHLQSIEDTTIVPLHNPTHGAFLDLAQALGNKADLADETVKALLAAVREQIKEPGRARPVRVYLHSQGGAIGAAMAQRLSLEERANVELISFGGAAHQYPPGLHSVTAYLNVQDMVPGLVGAGLPIIDRGGTFKNPNYNVLYTDFGEPGNWSTSHNLDGYVAQIQGKNPSSTWRALPATRWEATIRRILRGDNL